MTAVQVRDLAVCVIGRNQGSRLRNLSESLRPLRGQGLTVVTVFVDSGSDDGSPELAREFFDVVVSLPPVDRLCAAAGRYWGTRQVDAGWVLYIDGDMTLHPDFVGPVANLVRSDPAPDLAGIVGRCINVYPDGGRRTDVPERNPREGHAVQFGGAVLLRTAALAAAGGWDPALFSFEELDLYVRLRAVQRRVTYTDLPMVLHYTRRVAPIRKVLDNLIPAGSGLGLKFYGFGQLLAAHAARRTLSRLLRFHPFPFMWWAAWAAFAIVLPNAGPLAALSIPVAVGIYVSAMKGARFMVVYSLLAVQALAGVGRYRPGGIPRPAEIWRRDMDDAASIAGERGD